MDTKLTLKLDKSVIERAKKYAALHQSSLSRMVESYLKSITDKDLPENDGDIEISPFIKSMASGVKLPENFDYKKAYGKYLSEKYK